MGRGDYHSADAPRYHGLDCISGTAQSPVCFYRTTIRSLGAEEAPSSRVPRYLPSLTVQLDEEDPSRHLDPRPSPQRWCSRTNATNAPRSSGMGWGDCHGSNI